MKRALLLLALVGCGPGLETVYGVNVRPCGGTWATAHLTVLVEARPEQETHWNITDAHGQLQKAWANVGSFYLGVEGTGELTLSLDEGQTCTYFLGPLDPVTPPCSRCVRPASHGVCLEFAVDCNVCPGQCAVGAPFVDAGAL
jgi:hypothetical protein